MGMTRRISLKGRYISDMQITRMRGIVAATALLQVWDTATLTGGDSPTGTITFRLYGPDNAMCTGPAVFTSTVNVTDATSYESARTRPTSPGTYRWSPRTAVTGTTRK